MKRSGKFYRNNERDVMQELGFETTPNSGSGWIVKEDGQNENCICQLKSTDAKSIRVYLDDIHTLQYNALVSHKLPVFALQFLQSNEIFLLIMPQQLQEISQYLTSGKVSIQDSIVSTKPTKVKVARTVTSSKHARDNFSQELENRYRKEKSAT